MSEDTRREFDALRDELHEAMKAQHDSYSVVAAAIITDGWPWRVPVPPRGEDMLEHVQTSRRVIEKIGMPFVGYISFEGGVAMRYVKDIG